MIFLSRELAGLPLSQMVAVVAHECGHAVTRESEFTKRDGISSEWASELCADYHAFRWGFEKEIRAHAPFRSLAHHACLPGETISEAGREWRVDRWFHFRPVAGRREALPAPRPALPGAAPRSSARRR
ncbi:MAG: hypothetical protein IT379_39285 [Deltaproteobacteria bacterium]|nr:hypothetical protein [Deltaproteobacteria bacterium]